MSTVLKAQSLRDSLAKTVKMLTRQNVRVTFSGHQPYVRSKGGEVVSLNLPEINDNASDLLIDALQGYLDHECGHIFYTPFGRMQDLSKGDPIKGALLNIVEDIRLEKLLPRDLPGTKDNLERMYEKFIPLMVDKPTRSGVASPDPAKRLSSVLVPGLRALAGQGAFRRYMDDNDFWQHLEPLQNRLPDLADRLLGLEEYDDVIDLVDRIIKALGPNAQKPDFSHTPEEEESDEGGDEENEADEDQGSSSAEQDDTEQGDEDNTERGEKDNADEDDTQNDGGEENDTPEEEGDEEKGSEKNDTADQDEEPAGSDAGDDDGAADEETEGQDSSSSPKQDGAEEDETAEEQDDDTPGEESDDTASEPGEGEESGSSLDDFEGEDRTDQEQDFEDTDFEGMTLDPTRMLDMDQLFSQKIEQLIQQDDQQEFRVFTRDYDRVLDISGTEGQALDSIDQAVASATGPMQGELRRLIAARTQSRKLTGRRSGRLHAPNLHRILLNDDRVFFRREESPNLDTAISMVIDGSGSMSGGKAMIAAQAAYAIGTVLSRLGVPFECLGFTSGSKTDHVTTEYLERVKEANEIATIQRFMPIDMPKFKAFEESWTLPVRKRFAKSHNSGGTANGYRMGSTPEGCGVEFAARRLLKRPEQRKLMLVLTDGEPGADLFPSPKQNAWAYVQQSRDIVRAVSAAGIDIIGVGIQHDGPTRYYPNSIIIQNVNQLPAALLGALKKFMLK